ncbi:hypothetical protein BJ973_001679 [Actinoplanes tereljensis]|uniref:Uncharacterized protein n=1 Tax=Paractinoplanes tereljensis TaxID=571912 RepID=A0A919NM92_9ACTN|nr:hypothetical protein [Actinoplanes tereljensis]GIF20417.1 hypothetical protein Ate02nite_31470 [Actinoplanes tereljensis]
MRIFELLEALEEIATAKVKVRRGAVNIHQPALGDTAVLEPDDVTEAAAVFVPTGAPAIQLDIQRHREIIPLIVTDDDFVFTPVYADAVLAEGAELRVPAMPSLISYSEMHRDVRAFGKAMDEEQLEPDMLAATLLAHRCFLAGAIRVGLWPVRAAAWWEYANARIAPRMPLPPFRPDEVWDDLMADVAEARRQTEQAKIL